MLLLSILISLLGKPVVISDISISARFIEMTPGKPTLKYYKYNITLQNKGIQPKFVVLPNWFKEPIDLSGTITQVGEHTSDNGSLEYKLYASASCTAVLVPGKSKITLSSYQIETFDEEILEYETVEIPVVVCEGISIGNISIQEYFEQGGSTKEDSYKLEAATAATLIVPVK